MNVFTDLGVVSYTRYADGVMVCYTIFGISTTDKRRNDIVREKVFKFISNKELDLLNKPIPYNNADPTSPLMFGGGMRINPLPVNSTIKYPVV